MSTYLELHGLMKGLLRSYQPTPCLCSTFIRSFAHRCSGELLLVGFRRQAYGFIGFEVRTKGTHCDCTYLTAQRCPGYLVHHLDGQSLKVPSSGRMILRPNQRFF